MWLVCVCADIIPRSYVHCLAATVRQHHKCLVCLCALQVVCLTLVVHTTTHCTCTSHVSRRHRVIVHFRAIYEHSTRSYGSRVIPMTSSMPRWLLRRCWADYDVAAMSSTMTSDTAAAWSQFKQQFLQSSRKNVSTICDTYEKSDVVMG